MDARTLADWKSEKLTPELIEGYRKRVADEGRNPLGMYVKHEGGVQCAFCRLMANEGYYYEGIGEVCFYCGTRLTIRGLIDYIALQSQWVTITDDPGTLPGIGQRVWVVIGGFVQVTPAHFNGEEWEWLNDAGDPAPRNLVSHWQDYAVPAPPKADSSVTK